MTVSEMGRGGLVGQKFRDWRQNMVLLGPSRVAKACHSGVAWNPLLSVTPS